MTNPGLPSGEWVERAVERSAAVQRSRMRIAQQVRQMLDAARRLIDTKGDEFTTQELCAEAGVALQTFYRYFASKDELLLAVIGDVMVDACEYWTAAAAELPDPLARLRFYITPGPFDARKRPTGVAEPSAPELHERSADLEQHLLTPWSTTRSRCVGLNPSVMRKGRRPLRGPRPRSRCGRSR